MSHTNKPHGEYLPSVGQSVPHDASTAHVTGTSLFLEDVGLMGRELYVGFVGSPVAHGRIRTVDIADARSVPGVVGVYTHADVDGSKTFGPILQDEWFLAESECAYLGQPIVLIAGETMAAVSKAQRAVQIDMETLTPILTIDEAVFENSYIGPLRRIARGSPAAGFDAADFVLEGVFHSGGQEHFYLESQAAICYPSDDGVLTVHSSTQNPTEVQGVVAEVLGLGQHQVVCVCRRMGGAFGGKETQAALPALMAALVAQKTGRPARVIYTKDDDMKFTGKRHAYQTRWKAGFMQDGSVVGITMDFLSNGGATADLSTSVLDRTLFHADNAYFLSDIEITGRVCRTNLPPNTAFRGFGGPQAVAAIENIMEEIAHCTGRDAYDVRQINSYGLDDNNTTPYGQTVTNNLLPEIFPRLAREASYAERRAQITEFNSKSHSQIKGLSMTPVKFGISFTTKFLNQGNALVNVYKDGTVQVSTGGTEMGQGLNTKIRQIVADEFGIPLSHVMVMPTSTEKNNNTSPTAASASTDLNGAAAVDACTKIRARLTEFAAHYFAEGDDTLAEDVSAVSFAGGYVSDARSSRHKLSFTDLVGLAYHARISLGERGFYATPGLSYDPVLGAGSPFFYYTTGCALSEVTIDRWTGALTVDRVDLLMDIGKSINPAIDRGQVTGGFIQGMGWVTTEELKYAHDGALLSYSPTTYKVPCALDVPAEFNISFIENNANIANVKRSKAVGEPPLLLGVSVWAAVKNALSYVSADATRSLHLPATGEQILLCLHHKSELDQTVTPETDDALLRTEHTRKDAQAALLAAP